MCFKTQGLFKCGKCPECLQERRLQWSIRLIEQSKRQKCFAALLTYSPDNVPMIDGMMSVRKRDVQLFLKRLRHEFKAPIKYYISAEYSPQKLRPHYHCLFFGFPQEMEANEIKKILQRTWRLGFVGSRSNWIKDDAQVHYATSYIINLYDWKDNDRRERPFNLISKGLGMICDKLENYDLDRETQFLKYGWHYDVDSKCLILNSPLEWNFDNKCFDVADDFLETIDTIKIQQTHFNPRTRTTTLGNVQSFPLPRIWREKYLSYDERMFINFLKDIKARLRLREYNEKYSDYDSKTDFPMWKQIKYHKWKFRKKNKKDKLLSNPDIYFL